MELDLIYDNLCKDIFEELNQSLQYKFCGSKLQKRYRNSKPHWNEHLGNLWQIMVYKEKEFIKYKGVNKGIKGRISRRHKMCFTKNCGELLGNTTEKL